MGQVSFHPRTWLSSQPVGTQEWECGFKREKGQTAKKQRIWEKKSESKENEARAMSKALCFFGGISKGSPAIQGKQPAAHLRSFRQVLHLWMPARQRQTKSHSRKLSNTRVKTTGKFHGKKKASNPSCYTKPFGQTTKPTLIAIKTILVICIILFLHLSHTCSYTLL